jgi:hypothetical protein
MVFPRIDARQVAKRGRPKVSVTHCHNRIFFVAVGNLSHQFARHPVKLRLKLVLTESILGAKGEWLWMRACTRAFATGDKIPATSGLFGHQRKTSIAIGLTAADHRSSGFYSDDARDEKAQDNGDAVAVRSIEA